MNKSKDYINFVCKKNIKIQSDVLVAKIFVISNII
jgi:hypothetical protein